MGNIWSYMKDNSKYDLSRKKKKKKKKKISKKRLDPLKDRKSGILWFKRMWHSSNMYIGDEERKDLFNEMIGAYEVTCVNQYYRYALVVRSWRNDAYYSSGNANSFFKSKDIQLIFMRPGHMYDLENTIAIVKSIRAKIDKVD